MDARNLMQAPFTRFPQPVVCSICNKQYKDVHEHIEHMTTVHQMKASFRCSTCGQIFPTKVAVEAHLATHAASGNGTSTAEATLPITAINLSSNGNNNTNNAGKSNNGRSSSASSKEGDKPASSSSGSSILSNIQVTRSACDAENVLALDIEEDEEEDGDDDLLREVYSCLCGKAYFLKMSFDAHQKICPAKMKQYSSDGKASTPKEANQSRLADSVTKRIQGRGRSLGALESLGSELIGSETAYCRKMVEKIHSDGDTNCKACLKPMKGFISLCSHLSRRSECREFYNNNLVSGQGKEGERSFASSTSNDKSKLSIDSSDKSNNSFSKSDDSSLQPKRSSSGTPASSSASSTGGNASSGGGPNDSKGQGFSPAFNELGPEDIIIAPSDELIRRAYLVRNRVQCPRCSKIFGGKTPAVAYNNHRRNKHCPATQATVPYLKAKFNKNKDQQPSPQAADIVPATAANNPSAPQELESKLPDSHAQVRYYCKLCPNRDIKNRVSLGVHLTTYHGLPPVNISSNEGIALRCQTCSQTFNSKYFYNMHRYECDLTSPYIGILEADKNSTESEDSSAIECTNVNAENEEESSAHLPAPPPSIMPPPIQSISPTPASPQAQITQHQQLGSNSSPSSVGSTPSSISTNSQSQLSKVQPTFNTPPRGSAVSNAYFGSNYTCTLCHKKGFPGPNAVRIHQKYQCIKRPLVPPPKSPYPSPLAKPRTKSYSRPLSREESQSEAETNDSRLAALLESPNPSGLNSQIKGEHPNELSRLHDSGLLMCDDCGRGPYNSQYYLLEHKRQFCQVGKINRNNVPSPSNSSSSKSIDIESALEQIPKSNFSSKANDSSNQIVPPSSNNRSVPQKINNSKDVCRDGNMVTNGSFVHDKSTKNGGKNVNINNGNNNSKDPHDFVDIDMPENVPLADSDHIIRCSECDLRETDILKFVRHRLKHYVDKPENANNLTTYSCEICKGKTVTSQLYRMRQHLYHHVKIYNALYKKDNFKERKKRTYPFENDISDNEDLITCPYCRACQFEDAVGLSDHIKTSCLYRFHCIKCDRTFLSKSSLEEHKETCLEEVDSSNSKSLISCHHCGLKFNSRQRRFYHEQACHKVYNADVSQRVEELIERASTCAICGLRAKNYIVKAKHEVKCLEMALDSLGIKCLRFDNVEDNETDSSIANRESIDQSSLISDIVEGQVEEVQEEKEGAGEEEGEEVEGEVSKENKEGNGIEEMKLSEEEMEKALVKKFGITKEIVVVVSRIEDESNDENDADYENSADHTNKLELLKQTFERLLRHLVPEDDVFKEILNDKPVDVALASILKMMGSEAKVNHKSNYIGNFRENIQTFLQLSIKKETLDKAYQKTKTVDEVIHNLLNVQ